MPRKSDDITAGEKVYKIEQLGARDVMRLSVKVMEISDSYNEEEEEVSRLGHLEDATDEQKLASNTVWGRAIYRTIGGSEAWVDFVASIICKSINIKEDAFDDRFIDVPLEDVGKLFLGIYNFNAGSADKKKEDPTT